MHRLSMVQALALWSDFEAALRGEHRFGGHDAEIYASRFDVAGGQTESAAAFANLAAAFRTGRNATVRIDDLVPEEWVRTRGHIAFHRVVVSIAARTPR